MDPVHFSGKELLDMAIRIEENGERFYNVAAEAARTEKLADLFNFLAGEEKKHASYFIGLKKQLTEPHMRTVFEPYAEEALLYLKSIANTKIFTSSEALERLAMEVGDEKAAIDYAIDMEKDSLLFYYEFMKGVRGSDQEVLEKLIQAEKEHLKKLKDLRGELFG